MVNVQCILLIGKAMYTKACIPKHWEKKKSDRNSISLKHTIKETSKEFKKSIFCRKLKCWKHMFLWVGSQGWWRRHLLVLLDIFHSIFQVP